MKPVIRIDIVSDVVCPWCYIGKRRIEKAMTELQNEFDFDVNYVPYELNPKTPRKGFDQKEYLSKKFGSEEKYNQITTHVTKVATEEGLQFDFKRQNVSPNTKDLHRVIWLAKKEGRQPEVKEAFMKAYFVQGVDLTRKENVVLVAASIGLESSKVATLLDSTEGLKEVDQMEQLNHQRGVNGVPFYIINNEYAISGAQPSSVFIQALKQIGSELTLAEGDVCQADNKNCQ